MNQTHTTSEELAQESYSRANEPGAPGREPLVTRISEVSTFRRSLTQVDRFM